MKIIKRIIKSLTRQIGLNIKKNNVSSSNSMQVAYTLKHFGIDTVFDIGANTGQFAQELRKEGYKSRIVSFEPLEEEHTKLQKKCDLDKNWLIHTRCALGSSEGDVEINVAKNSVSSSILPMMNLHKEAAPKSSYLNSQKTKLTTVDKISNNYTDKESTLYIKIDTQGYEFEVLKGAKETLKKAKGIQIELSLVPLYEGQPIWTDIITYLKDLGFSVWAIQPGFTHPKTGQTLQVDAIFINQQ